MQKLMGVWLVCLFGVACASAPPAVPPSVPVSVEQLPDLDEAQTRRVLDGEIVLSRHEFGEGLSAYRGTFLIEIPPDDLWAWLRDVQNLGDLSPEMTVWRRVRTNCDETRQTWEVVHEVFPKNIEYFSDYFVEDDLRRLRFELSPDYPHNVTEVAGFHRIYPTDRQEYSIYTWSTYIVFDWWWLPDWLAQTIEESKLRRLMTDYREFYASHRQEIIGE